MESHIHWKAFQSHSSKFCCNWSILAKTGTLPQMGFWTNGSKRYLTGAQNSKTRAFWWPKAIKKFILLLMRLYAIKKPWIANDIQSRNFRWMGQATIFEEWDQNAFQWMWNSVEWEYDHYFREWFTEFPKTTHWILISVRLFQGKCYPRFRLTGLHEIIDGNISINFFQVIW